MARELPKQLRKAPLVYVLVQVQIGSILAMEKFVPDIQEKLRHAGYPQFQRAVIQSVSLGPGAPRLAPQDIQRWDFNNKNGDTGFILTQNSCVFHTTAYQTFERFIEGFQLGLQLIHEVADIDLVERIGLRYVDVIEPAEDEDLSQYLHGGLSGFPIEEIPIRASLGSRTQSVATTDSGRIVLRCMKNNEGTLIPPDLMPLTLVLPRESPKGKPTVLLDIDHYAQYAPQPLDFSLEGIVDKIDRLHDLTREAFRVTVSDYAVERWR